MYEVFSFKIYNYLVVSIILYYYILLELSALLIKFNANDKMNNGAIARVIWKLRVAIALALITAL